MGSKRAIQGLKTSALGTLRIRYQRVNLATPPVALSVSDQIEIYAMVVDAMNDDTKGFYEQFGFISLPEQLDNLFLPISTCKVLIGTVS